MRNNHKVLTLAAVLAIASASITTTQAEDFVLRSFKKIKLTDKFYSEGCTTATSTRTARPTLSPGRSGTRGRTSRSGTRSTTGQAGRPARVLGQLPVAYTHDFNADGWADVLVIGFPGAETAWYQNPGGKRQAPWKPTRRIHDRTDNESPTFGDLTGDGKPELIFHSHGLLGWAEPDAANPTKPVDVPQGQPHAQGGWVQRFTHGLRLRRRQRRRQARPARGARAGGNSRPA